jgi:hypothetical protein
MNRAILAALSFICAAALVHAQDFSTEELSRRTVERRAVEAVIWGTPAVNFDRMYQAMVRDAKAGEGSNKIVFWSRLFDWKNQTLTPNPDSIYFMPFFDTKDVGPVVLEIPPADGGSITGSVDDCWQTAIEDVGPAGVDKGKGGKYLILPPSYKDKVPPGYVEVRRQGAQGYTPITDQRCDLIIKQVAEELERRKLDADIWKYGEHPDARYYAAQICLRGHATVPMVRQISSEGNIAPSVATNASTPANTARLLFAGRVSTRLHTFAHLFATNAHVRTLRWKIVCKLRRNYSITMTNYRSKSARRCGTC